MDRFYITTPIYYPSDKLHIGHTYCTVATDALARYHRLKGEEVLFLTGTDEHGQKIEKKAQEAGVTPQAFVDRIVDGPKGVRDLWKLMNISNDRFIRTTDDYHVKAIQRIFRRMYENGDIYKGAYKGKYCTDCESFWTESQLKDGCCPDCGRPVTDAEEEAYFFKLSKYADDIRDLLEGRNPKYPNFLQPQSRVNEMVKNFIDPGLEDLCVSRTSFKWGIPVDFDEGHVVYVWIDALSNYITALGYENDRYNDYETFWGGTSGNHDKLDRDGAKHLTSVNIVGKEIVRFHSIIWPAMLMSLGEPLPDHVFGHGWLLLDGGKMSKSKGNVVDPYLLAEQFGVDALRFFLLRTFPFGSDGNFSNELLIQTINTDLANDLGNLVSRTTAMVQKYFGGILPFGCGPNDSQRSAERDLARLTAEGWCGISAASETPEQWLAGQVNRAQGQWQKNYYFEDLQDSNGKIAYFYLSHFDGESDFQLICQAMSLRRHYKRDMDAFAPHSALSDIFEVIQWANKYIDVNAPWVLAKDMEKNGARLAHVLYNLLETARICGILLTPFIPESCEKLFAQIGAPADARTWESAGTWGALPETAAVTKGENLFPRVDADKALEALEAASQAAKQAALPALELEPQAAEMVDFDTFCKSDFRVVKVKACEAVKKSAKLLRFTLDDGTGTDRQILSGIHAFYEPDQLVGKTLAAIVNLPPRKMMGLESCGMLLSAVHREKGEEKLNLIILDDAIPAGAKLC